ncbi:MAG TPA: hypothetical protein VFF72_12045, partial [Caldimonas sp.]|nr:hypothetical protein [Caldimonas sp.]
MNSAVAPSVTARLAGIGTAVLGLVAMAGWALDKAALRSVLRGAVEMKANTAASLILAGTALYLGAHGSSSHQRATRLLAIVVAMVGVATGLEYALGLNLHIDELLFVDTGKAYNAIRGRMSPYSTVGFLGIGMALALLPSMRWRPVVWLLSALVAGIGLVSMLGYVWNASELVTDSVLPPVAIHTGLAFTLLGIGTLRASRPRLAMAAGTLPNLASIELKVAAGLFGAFILLIAAGGIAYETSAAAAASARAVLRSQEIRSTLHQLY